mmetsp:Transcript_12912/g.19653  ORF Transcript_12912/g.19653 Transcript_12912/m.19653 type:complete len:998 (-) Transcript_12912:151-3144(-)
MTKQFAPGHQRWRAAAIALMLASTSDAFVPTASMRSGCITSTTNSAFVPSVSMLGACPGGVAPSFARRKSTALNMSDSTFSEGTYTEAAWGAIASLPKVGDYYSVQTIESPLLLDVLLNPAKHKAGDNAIAAQKTVEKVLVSADVDLVTLRRELENYLSKQLQVKGSNANKTTGRSLSVVLDKAMDMKTTLNDSFVSTEALLLSVVKNDDKFTVEALKRQDVSYEKVLAAVKELRKVSGPATSRSAETLYDALSKYGRDFTEMAMLGKLDPVIGRDDEIRRAIQILSRRTKNNPILLGDPGVGKTAIAEGIAQRMVAGDVPDTLKPPCKLIGLDLGALVAGATMRGEFEERLKSVLEEVTQSRGEVILFIDEMHTVVGAGSAQGSMDASNLLKPALARGELRCIGATTMNEYRMYIEKDKALERRFQQVMINQPSPEDTVSILRGLKPRYEVHHGVRIRDEALLAAAKLSHRYIPDRFLPDKAIDLIDEACAKLKNELTSKPTILDEVDRRIIQLEMEKLSLQSDFTGEEGGAGGGIPPKRLQAIEEELTNLKTEQAELTAKWESERGDVDRVKDIREQIEAVRLEIEQCERNFDLNRAAELKYSTLPGLEAELEKKEALADELAAKGDTGEAKMLRDEVVAEDIAKVVAIWTGIPPQKLVETERDRILNMAENLKERVVGQNDAIEVVTEAIQRSRAGLNDPSKPIASLIFLGPTGVGKTELCKALAEFMFDTEEALIRIDMSEYMEKHTVSRLLGAPPGYVGYDEGGQLTDAVRRKPYSVLLFDEMEKAHPDVFNVMLQILDDGRVTDSKGNLVNFRNCVIIFTSNIGSQDIIDLNGSSEIEDQAMMRERVTKAMKDNFKPEFLNRIDENVIFNSLSKENLRGIVKIECRRLEQRLEDRSIKLAMSDDALDYLADVGYDRSYGARPLKRTIQRELETVVARLILKGEIDNGDTIVVDVVNDRISVTKALDTIVTGPKVKGELPESDGKILDGVLE